ncbi:15551_t:CDS:2, partial [Funneliformis caledonium]
DLTSSESYTSMSIYHTYLLSEVEDLTNDFTGSTRLDDSYSDCLNEHHIRESVDLNDEKVSGGSGSGTFGHLANLLVRRSTDPKDENDENIYYDSI